MAGRLALLSTSHRVATGLLTHSAWRTLEAADRVWAPAEHSLLPVLADAGVTVQAAPDLPPPERARWLLDQVGERTVVWLVADHGDEALTKSLAPLMAEAADAGSPPELEVIHGSFDVPGSRLIDLVSVMDRLRSPGGCPWDAEQTHQTLAPYLLEEAYETLEAIDAAEPDALREELGDLLLQVVFHARIAEESSDRPWSVDDVAAGIVDKLVRRHPHVFSDGSARTAAEVEETWEHLKSAEKGRQSSLDGIPSALPALALADKMIARASRNDVAIEIDEPDLPDGLSGEQLGTILLGLVSVARRRGLDAESLLRQETVRFAERVRTYERARARQPGSSSEGG